MKIFISAGEVSGEMHAANLAKELKGIDAGISISAVGGDRLKAVSDDFIYNLVNLSAFGFWQPLKQYFLLRNILKEKVFGYWNSNPPDKVVLVDYYGFNIRIAKEARRRGIPVYYYVSPQVWASRSGRIKIIARYVKKMLVILPFEEDLYKKAGVDTVFVGHPLLDAIPESVHAVENKPQRPVIGLFPGSRKNIVEKHLGILEESAALIGKKIPSEFKIFAPPNITKDLAFAKYPVVSEQGFEERRKLSLAITTSGTVSLENALLGIPMIVMYKLSRFNYMIARMIVNINFITMANILFGKEVVPELIQKDANPQKISAAAVGLLKNPGAAEQMRKQLLSIRKILGNPGVSRRAAGIILNDR
ncbi:MAG: lipid-A-disaccharide synthase [Elusimicrobiota bacterium]